MPDTPYVTVTSTVEVAWDDGSKSTISFTTAGTALEALPAAASNLLDQVSTRAVKAVEELENEIAS